MAESMLVALATLSIPAVSQTTLASDCSQFVGTFPRCVFSSAWNSGKFSTSIDVYKGVTIRSTVDRDGKRSFVIEKTKVDPETQTEIQEVSTFIADGVDHPASSVAENSYYRSRGWADGK